MTELYEKSIKKLELPAVLTLLADHAVGEAAKQRCLSLSPAIDKDAVSLLQKETSDACRIISLKGAPAFSDVTDISLSLDRADRGGMLTMSELLKIAQLLRCTREVKRFAETDAVASSLDSLFSQLVPNKFFEERLTASILSEDEMADAASSELADIRRHMRAKTAQIRQSLQKLITSPAYAKILQEPIITIRDGRFVVPVKSECKGDVPGMVHDVSSSGGTLFIEPMSAVNANNELKELSVREQQEIDRILASFSAEAASKRAELEEDYAVLTSLDCIFARAKLSFAMRAMEPEITDDGKINLIHARHPLIDRETVVPISLTLGDMFDTLVITGPNTGGKTVTLKTIGLLTLMAECGLHIPAESGSSVSVFRSILADIGDEQSIEQSLSTFSSHMKNIVQILDACDDRCLVLFDELGAGTDPAEGAALAIALIESCRARGARIAATTHYAELKVFAMRTEGVTNACCEFDVQTLKPTYRLLIGVPGKSNAFAISQRLGLSESVLEKARGMMDGSSAELEDVLSKLEEQRQQMEKAREEAEKLRLQTQQQKEKTDAYYEEIRKQRERAEQTARREAQHILDDARRVADQVQQELKELRKQVAAGSFEGTNVRQTELRQKLNDAEAKLSVRQKEKKKQTPTRPIVAGDTVELLKLGTTAKVLQVLNDGSLELQAGALKLTAKQSEVNLVELPTQKTVRTIATSGQPIRKPAQPELDLRGMTADEAVSVLEKFLDDALLANLPSVRIIHGKGTGVLRSAVSDCLRKHKRVHSFRLGVYGEGEDGVTIAELK